MAAANQLEKKEASHSSRNASAEACEAIDANEQVAMLDEQASMELESSQSAALSRQSPRRIAQPDREHGLAAAGRPVSRQPPDPSERRRRNREALALADDIRELTEDDEQTEPIAVREPQVKNPDRLSANVTK